jgi:hypothetical protein
MAIDPQKLLPPGRPDTPEGNVDREGTSAGYVTEKQYNSLNKNILAIRRNLSAIADLLVKRGQQDAVEDNQEIDKKRKEIDKTAKGAEENFVESSIKQALIKPVQALGKKIRGPFDGFMKALESLFMGWLGLKGIDALEAWQKGDTEALEQIKNDLIKGLAVAAGIGLALNGGIGAVAGVISSLLTNMLFQLPKLIGLMANPWVWLGAAAVYGGIKLLEIMKNMGLSGQGRGSYESYTQEVIDMVGKIGKQKTIEELERRKKRLLQQNPWLNIPGAKQFTPQGSLVLEIEQNIRSVQSGEFDRYDPTKVSAADKKIVNDISSAIGSLAQYKRTYDQLTAQMKTLLGGKQVVELEPKDRAKYEQLQESHDRLFAQMKASMKYTQGLINDLSLEGRDFVEAKFGRAGNAEMFKSTGVDFPINIPGLPPFQLQAGDPDPTRLQNLPQIQTELNTIKPASQRVEASSEKATKAAANGLNETMQLTKQVNINLAENLAKEAYEMPAFTFMPYSSEGRTALEPVATAAVGTGYPTNFLTQNPYNAKNLIFSASVFETP